MRSLKCKVTVCFLITLLAGLLPNYNSKAQSPSDFPTVVSTELFPFDNMKTFSNDLHYYFAFGSFKEIINTENSDRVFFSKEPGLLLAGWSANSSYLAFIDKWTACLSPEDEGNLVLFDAETAEISRICLPFGIELGDIQWSPFDNYTLALFDPNQLLDIRTQKFVPFEFLDRVDLSNLGDLVGYGKYLWDSTTQLPVARIELSENINKNALISSAFQICSNQCVELLDTIQAAPNSGSVFEWRVWGHWLLWGVYEFTDGVPYAISSATVSYVSDAAIYITDLTNHTTQPLFRFSSLDLSDLRVSSLGLSPDGKTIALPLSSTENIESFPLDRINSSWFHTGTLLLHLNWPTSPDDSPTGKPQ